MDLSNASKLRLNGSDVKLVKLNGVVIYSKKEDDTSSNVIAKYTSSTSNVLPTFNTGYSEYSVEEIDNGDGTWTSILIRAGDSKPEMISFKDLNTLLYIHEIDTSNVTNMQYMFHNCSQLTSLDSMMNISTDLSLPSNLDKESVLDIIDNLVTVSSTKVLTVSATQLEWLSEDKITEANNKGWTIRA